MSDDARRSASLLDPSDTFARRHLAPREGDVREMLARVGSESLEKLVDATVPASIRTKGLELSPLPGQEARPLGLSIASPVGSRS